MLVDQSAMPGVEHRVDSGFAALILLLYLQTVEQVANIARASEDVETMRSASFILHSGVGLALLLVATALAVYKPRGVTRYGWRKQQELVSSVR